MDLGLPFGARVVVAMSGGVDSSVVAALLTEAGYETIGITLQLYSAASSRPSGKTCCAGQDIYDAREVADTLGIPHYVLDMEARFREAVIEDFADSYLAGQTPTPCIRCNQSVKFTDLVSAARDLGAAALATGHYVQRRMGKNGPELARARDLAKDQSYFLFATTDEQLDFCRFPLGGLEKHETRAHAERLALPVARKPESQDICFVPSGSYGTMVDKIRPDGRQPGDVVHVDGHVIGQHDGIIDYTVGQRRGLKVSTGERLYVVEIDPDRHRIMVGPRQSTYTRKARLIDVNLLSDVEGESLVMTKHRYNEPAVAATFAPQTATLTFDEPQSSVAKGQAAVLYDDDRLIGGGWIAATSR